MVENYWASDYCTFTAGCREEEQAALISLGDKVTVLIRADMKNSVLPLTCAVKYFPDEKIL